MRTITLELLRHGPPNNQLLSPLTPYLALCENHPAVTVHVPFEHNQFLHRLGALSYKQGVEARDFYIRETAQILGHLLAAIPGLTAELSRGDVQGTRLTHLRLIISSSELALLPFELASAPNGFPGAGQPLLLQSQSPLCLTREVRRVQEQHVHWPSTPRILLVAASPPGLPPVPLESHVLALRRAIDPWLDSDGGSELARSRIEDHMMVLPQASDEAIETACAAGGFTHVHILAHGVEYTTGYDVRFGLALHDARHPGADPVIVDGPRLATIVRATRRPDRVDLARPVVVTLASCHSGGQGSVAGAGASVAHALHEAGVPMVVASQFPLSFEGSVRFVEVLYGGLLWGDDPRVLLSDLRRRLHSQLPTNHDWASITAYAALPAALDAELTSVKIDQAMRKINVAMAVADRATRRFFTKLSESEDEPLPAPDSDAPLGLEDAKDRIDSAKDMLLRLRDETSERQALIYGYLASTEKRQAEIFYSAWTIQASRENEDESHRALVRARDYYWQAFQWARANSWGVVQYLSLSIVLQRISSSPHLYPPEPQPEDLDNLWTLARTLSLQDLHHSDAQPRVWALANLIELNLLCLVMPKHPSRPDRKSAEAKALEYARELVALAGRDSFEVYSTRRQMVRYYQWFADPQVAGLHEVVGLAEQLADALVGRWHGGFGRSAMGRSG